MSELRARLRWSDTFGEAFAATGRRPARTALTALGTVLGVAAFVTTTGLAATANAQVAESFDALKATEVRVQDLEPDGTNPFPIDADARLQRLSGVNNAGLFSPVVASRPLDPRRTASRPLGPVADPIPVIAATPGALRASRPTLATGTLYNDFHEQRAESVVVLGRVAADQLGITRVDNQPAVFIEDVGYTVVGIIESSDRNPDLLAAAIMPISTEQRTIASQPGAFQVVIDTAPGAAALIGRQAPIALRPQQPDRLTSLVPPDPSRLRQDVESDVTSLYYALAALSLAVGTVAIANATLLSTIERRPEIGLRRALGARRSHIARQIIIEAATIGAIAGVVGTAIATIAVSVYATTRDWTTTLDPTLVLLAPVVGLVTGAVAGAWPALRASGVPPAETLRS